MLRLEQHTTSLPLQDTVPLPERPLQVGRLSKGRLQLGVLVFGRLLGRLTAASLGLAGLIRRSGLLPRALHLGLELALVVSQLATLLVRLDQGLLRLHHLGGGLRLKKLHLGLEAALVTRQLLMQPVGLVERPPSRGRLRPRLRRLDAKTDGIGIKPVVIMIGLEQLGPPR